MTPRVHLLDLKSYYRSPPYQLGLLAAYASADEGVRRGVTFRITEHPREQPAAAIVERILEEGADLLATSSYVWNRRKLGEVLDLLAAAPRRPRWILLGGPNCVGAYAEEQMRRFPVVSAMIEGEGEPGFRDVCRRLIDDPSENPFRGSRNTIALDPDGNVLREDCGHRVSSLDEIPSPYLSGILPVRPAPIFYETNRGCPYRCSFCYWGSGKAKLYRTSIDRVLEEIEFFARRRVSSLWLADANFGILPDDQRIAEGLVEINARHGYPIGHLGVNWAKSSSERVMDIAGTLRAGRIGCSTTLALQTLTPEAESTSRRYSLPPARFVGLVECARRQGTDSYTDLILGLPGETIDEFLDGLESVVWSGVPGIFIHHFTLLPGTEFWERRTELGIRLLGDEPGSTTDEEAASEYADYLVVVHPKMTRSDLERGTRLLAVSHVLFNHGLGRPPAAFLALHGVGIKEIVEAFERSFLGAEGCSPEKPGLFGDLAPIVKRFAETPGADEATFYRDLSRAVWFETARDGRERPRGESSMPALRSFFREVCLEHDARLGADEERLLDELVDFAVLVSPKPAWRPRRAYDFCFDVDALWRHLSDEITRPPEAHETWRDLSGVVRRRLVSRFGPEVIRSYEGPVRYSLHNPWRFPPLSASSDWIMTTTSHASRVVRTVRGHPAGVADG